MRTLITTTLIACTLFLNAQVENGCISIDFETFPDETPASGLILSDQYQDAFGLSFRLEGGGFPVLAQVGGDTAEAFGSAWGNDTPAPGVDIGEFFLTDDGQLSGLSSPAIILDFEIPIDSFAGCILDMDFEEFFIIQALDASGTVILEERIEAGDPGTGDGELTCWGFNLPGCEGSIYSIKYAGFRPASSPGAFGLGMDYFSFCYSGLQIDTETTPVTCDALGSINIFSTTDEVYEYSLDGINYSLNGFFDQLDQGIQVLYVRDSDNCTTTVDVTVELEIEELPDPIFVEEEICNGQSYTYNGEVYTDEGIYHQTLSAANGCDTIWNLTLTVLSTSSEVLSEEICDGETFELNGQNYSVGGVYEQVLNTAQGCDSIIEINLTVNPITEEAIMAQICEGESYSLNSETYVNSGLYSQQLINSFGCDSLLYLELEVQGIISEMVSAQICTGQTYILNNETYTVGGSYTQMLTSESGCDSLINLNLQEIEPTEESVTAQVCEGETFTLNGLSYTSEGTYIQMLTNQAGCDSLLTLVLEYTAPSSGNVSEEVCEGSEVIINGIQYNSAGSYSQSLVSTAGCDSLLNITISLLPTIETCESVIINEGEVFTLNGETYNAEGTYEQLLQSSDGCDSLVIIKIEVLPLSVALVHYDLNDCAAGGTSYDEFVPRYDEVLQCAEITASILNRPSGLTHSCTPGESGSGMCISSDPSCDYQNDSEHRMIFEVEINPTSGPVSISELRFFEKAPIRYQFNTGGTGLNNFPTLYSVTVFRDMTVIYTDEAVNTNRDWTQQSFSFNGLDPFVFDESGTLTVEFLAYCPIGIPSNVSAWDIDELRLSGYCQSDNNRVVGNIMTTRVEPLAMTTIGVESDSGWRYYESDNNGDFAFDTDSDQYAVLIEPVNNNDPLNGVSTLDLIYIQKHILGSQTFEGFTDLIAADINKDDKVTAMDLIELRKLILGVYETFPDNKSWRFLEAGKRYASISDLDDQMIITALDETINLEAVKIGDVNQSHLLNVNKSELDSRSIASYRLITTEHRNDDNKLVVTFIASEDIHISGFQAAFNVGNYNEVKLVSNRLDIAEHNYHLKKDELRIAWSSQSQLIKRDDVLFELVIGEERGAAYIDIVSEFPNEIYHAPDLISQSLIIQKQNDFIDADHTVELSIHPNPFHDVAKVQIVSKEKIATNYELLDVSGKVINSESILLEQGINEIDLNRTAFPGSGIYYIIIHRDQSVFIERFIML